MVTNFDKRKGHLCLLLMLLMSGTLLAQRPIEIVVQHELPLSNRLTDYFSTQPDYSLILVNQSFQDFDVTLKGRLSSLDGSVDVMLRDEYVSGVIQLEAQQMKVLMREEVEEVFQNLTLEDAIIEGVDVDQFQDPENLTLPDAMYEFCLYVHEAETGIPLSECCHMLEINAKHRVQIIDPYTDDEVIEEEIFPIQWEVNVDPIKAMDLEYEVKIIDLTLYNEQFGSPMEVFNEGAIDVVLEKTIEMGQTIMFYNQDGSDPELSIGHQYGIRVRAIDPMMEVDFENEGYSEIRTFFYKESKNPDLDPDPDPDPDPIDLPEDCASRCEIPDLGGMTAISPEGIDHFYLGYFDVTDLNISASGNTFSGEGVVTIDFLNQISVPISFENIQINGQHRAISGRARAKQDDVPEIQDVYDALNLGVLEPAAEFAEDYISSYIPPEVSYSLGQALRNGRMLYQLASGGEVGMPIGLSQKVQDNEFTLGITAMEFTPTGARCRVIAGFTVQAFERGNWIMFEGQGVCLHPGGFGGEYSLSLGRNLVFGRGNENKYELVFNGGENMDSPPCRLNMTCNGIESAEINGQLLFSRKHFLPDSMGTGVIDTGRAKAHFGFEWIKNQSDLESEQLDAAGSGKAHWIARLDIPPFQIKGLDGWTFSVEEGYLDMSDLNNPDQIAFPENYTHSSSDFRGLGFKTIAVQAPPGLQIQERKKVQISNMLVELIDDPRLYLKAEAHRLIEEGNGSMDGWAFTMDYMHIEIFNNSLASGSLSGAVSMPFLDSAQYISYEARIDEELDDLGDRRYAYNFNVSPSSDVNIPIFIANATLDESSYIELGNRADGSGKFYAETGIVGSITVDTRACLPEKYRDKINIPASLKMPGIDFGLEYSSVTGFNQDACHFGFASPMKFMQNLPININNLGLVFRDSNLGFSGDVELKLMEGNNDLAVTGGFEIVSSLGLPGLEEAGDLGGYLGSSIKHFKLTAFNVRKIDVDAEFSGMTINGELEFYNNELENGGQDKGIRGAVEASLPLDILVTVEAQFGTYGGPPENGTEDNLYSSSYFPYFYLDGSAIFPAGIPLGALAIRGFGGGVANNMRFVSAPSSSEGAEVRGRSEFAPHYGEMWFKGMMVMALSSNERTFNGDVGLEAQFNQNHGLTRVGVLGKAYFMTALSERLDPKVMLGMNVNIYPGNQEQDFKIEGEFITTVNVPLGDVGSLKGGARDTTFMGYPMTNVMANGNLFVSNEKWFLHVGHPDLPKRGRLLLNLGAEQEDVEGSVGAELTSYLMVGHDVPTEMPPMPAEVVRLLNGQTGNAETDSDPNEARVSPGADQGTLETGAGFANGAHLAIHAKVNAFILEAYLNAYLGFDINITQRQTQCAGYGQIGINGWYGEGQAYCGIEGGMNLKFKVFGKEKTFILGEFGCALALQGGFPRPAYFVGRAGVYYNIMNGLIKGKSSFQVLVGERCQALIDDPLAGIDFIQNITPSDGERNVFVGSPVEVEFALPMEELLDIPDVNEVDGETRVTSHYYRPYVARATLKKVGGETVVAARVWNSSNNVLRLKPQQTLDPRTDYEVMIEIMAKEGLSRNDCNHTLNVDGQAWKQSKSIRFRTARYPDDLYQFAQYSQPGHMQRHYLQVNSRGYLQVSPIDEGRMFYTSDLLQGKENCRYFIRMKNLTTLEVTEHPLQYNSYEHIIHFDCGDLDLRTNYRWEVIRKYTDRVGAKTLLPLTLVWNDKGTGVQDSLAVGGERAAFDHDENKNEDVMYHSYFSTSAYSSLSEKWQATSTELVRAQLNKGYFKVACQGEPWTWKDLNAYKSISQVTDDRYVSRMVAYDDLHHSYYTQIKDKMRGWVIRVAAVLATLPQMEVADLYDGLNFDWNTLERFRILSNRFSGQIDLDLKESELNSEGIGSSRGRSLPSGGGPTLYRTGTYYILHDAHAKMEQDRRLLEEMVVDVLTHPLYRNNSSIQTLLSELRRDKFSLNSNRSTYQMTFMQSLDSRPIMSSDFETLWKEDVNFLPTLNIFDKFDLNLSNQ